MTRHGLAMISLLAGLLTMSARGQEATFEGLGDLSGGLYRSHAFGVSDDGLFTVGQSQTDGGTSAFVWEREAGMTALPPLPGGEPFTHAFDGANGGGIVVGTGFLTDGRSEPVRWVDGIAHGLGWFEGGERGEARAVSADGAVCVGYAEYGDGQGNQVIAPFRWENGELVNLGTLFPENDQGGLALGVSADGAIVVGASTNEDYVGQAFRWADGVMTALEPLLGAQGSGGGTGASATDVSDDGSVIVGTQGIDGSPRVVRWVDETPVDTGVTGEAFAVSGDGAIIVGRFVPQTAMIWDETNGARAVRTVLESDYGLDLTGWTLLIATDISTDGRVIAGWGTNPDGNIEAWRVTLPSPDTDGDGLSDDWEINGIPYTDSSGGEQRYVLPDADPRHKDLYVEVDAMQGLSLANGAKQQLEFAFETAPVPNPDGGDGITLHIIDDETDLAHVAAWPVTGCWPNDFYDYKAMHFGSTAERDSDDREALLAAKAKAFRYCIIADRSDPSYGGCGERPGNDFVVYAGVAGGGDADEDVASVFMHELGHNLGLHHGGGDSVNGKPNYPSIMNYAIGYRFGWNRTFWRLDFVRFDDFLPLDEASLDEQRGVGRAQGFYSDWIMPFGAWIPDENGDPFRSIQFVHLDGRPTDFGKPDGSGYLDGQTDGTVKQDLNYAVDPPGNIHLPTGPSPDETMEPYHDWAQLQLAVPEDGDGPTEYPDEVPWETVQWIDENFPDPPCLMDFDRNGVVDFTDLLELLGAWGSENDHAHDVAPEGGDGLINFNDLLAVLNAWGPCP